MTEEERQIRRKREKDLADFLRERSREICEGDGFKKNRVAVTSAAREKMFSDWLEDALKDAFKAKLPVPRGLKKSKKKSSRILNIALSDLHYGSALDPREVGHRYGAVEEARRTAAICKQVAEYKTQYRDDTELYVHILGDVIQNQLHDARDGLPLAEQVASAMRILIQAVRYLAFHFPKVTVFCTPGNHGRITSRHKDRAVFQKWDSIETMIYVGLKEGVSNLPNTQVRLGYEPKYDFEAFGQLGFATHGDTVLNPGYPGKSIDVAGMKRQVNEINNARASKGQEPYRLFIVGHVHVGAMVHLPGGAVILTNGCLLPSDAYATSIGIFDTECGQWLWESVKGHIVGDSRFIGVGPENDADASLDAIVAPFAGL